MDGWMGKRGEGALCFHPHEKKSRDSLAQFQEVAARDGRLLGQQVDDQVAARGLQEDGHFLGRGGS